jgi:[protein-PII] uridylyltransferase
MPATGDMTVDAPTEESIAARLAAARAHAAAGLRAGKGGIELAQALTDAIEAMVVELCDRHLAEAGASSIAILATGGFGRREFAPFSDLDLVFLCADAPDAGVVELARSILHPLWDAKVDAGHAVRSVAEALELPATDLTAATALLDARFLTGDRALA